MNTSPAFSPASLRYDSPTIVLHWMTAALVAGLWGLAQLEELVSRPQRHGLWSVHIAFGGMLLLVLLVRFGWRARRGLRLPPVDVGLLGRMSEWTHRLLYVLVAAAVLLGIANTLVRGWDFAGVVSIPAFAPDDRALRRTVNNLHEWAANATLVIAALHAAAALFHHYVLRDGVLRRMKIARAR